MPSDETTDETKRELVARVAAHVGAPTPTAGGFLSECAEAAQALVTEYLGAAAGRVPGPILARAITEVAADLYHRRAARNGVAGFEDSELAPAPVRINRDPLAPAYPLLRRYTGPAIA